MLRLWRQRQLWLRIAVAVQLQAVAARSSLRSLWMRHRLQQATSSSADGTARQARSARSMLCWRRRAAATAAVSQLAAANQLVAAKLLTQPADAKRSLWRRLLRHAVHQLWLRNLCDPCGCDAAATAAVATKKCGGTVEQAVPKKSKAAATLAVIACGCASACSSCTGSAAPVAAPAVTATLLPCLQHRS